MTAEFLSMIIFKRTMLIYENSDFFDKLLYISNNYYKVNKDLSYIFRYICNRINKDKKVVPLDVEERGTADVCVIIYEQSSIR